ncbi:MAG: virginiamycin B lyase family protein [Thermoanaerobaculia bacterium]
MNRRSLVPAACVMAMALQGLSSPLRADSFVWDFSPAASPRWPGDWRIQGGIAAIGNDLWATGVTVSTNRATIFKIDLATGASGAYPLGPEFGATPIALRITEGPGGNAWFIGAQLGTEPLPVPADGAFLGEVTATGTISMTALPTGVFNNNSYPSMAYDPASGLLVWTQASGTGPAFGIGVRTSQGQIATVGLSAPGGPTSIALGKDGAFYFADTWLTGIRIGRLTTAGGLSFVGQVTFPQGTGPGGGTPPLITAGANGDLYFSDPVENAICLLSSSGTITKYTVPTAQSGISSLALGQDGNVYFGELAAGKVGRLTASTGSFAEIVVPTIFNEAVNLLIPSPIFTPGWGGTFAAAFLGPGLLRIRDAGSPCPQVRNRALNPLVVQTGNTFGIDLGYPPDHQANGSGFPPGTGVQHGPQSFGAGGAAQKPGEYLGSVTVIDSAQCPVDDVQLPITALPPPGTPCDPATFANGLCLLQPSRFWLGLWAVDPRTGIAALGDPIPQLSSFGYFSLPHFTGDPAFPEVMVKMIDARSISCCVWLFHTGLTDLQYTLTAFDTVTGNFKQYRNDRSDPTRLCGAADTGYFDGVSPAPSAASFPAEPSFSEDSPSLAASSCAPGGETICLLGNRFSAALSAVDPRTGGSGIGHAIPQKDNFGYFSLPSFTGDPTFPEVFVKMADARSFSCCFWVFHSGLTDLEYTLTITDTSSGAIRTYHNDRSDPSELCGGADTSAFH